MRRLGRTARRAAVILFVAGVGAGALAGCIDQGTPTPTATTSASPSASPEPEPQIDLDGTAVQNQPYFDLVNERLIAAGGTLDGRAFIGNLVAAGYPIAAMEVTPDRTSINGAADNIQFSIRLGDTCLVGQYGNVGYASTTDVVLATDRCLVGVTRVIDWGP